MPDGVIILEPGDEKAQKIAKAISSKTANDILQLLKGGSHPSTQIAEALGIPITTVQYHLENLVEAGMIAVVEKRWSRKGREVKIYGLKDQLVIVVPHGGDLKGILLKYASLFAVVIFASLVLALLGPAFGMGAGPVLQNALPPGAPPAVADGTGAVVEHLYKEAAANLTPVAAATRATQEIAPVTAPVTAGLPLPVVFFLGGCLALLVMIGYEVWLWYRRSK